MARKSKKIQRTLKCWVKKTTNITSKISKEVLKSTSDIEIADADPFDAIEMVLFNIPAAAVKIAKQETRKERRQYIPAAVRRAVLERDKHRCVVCKTKTSLELHHYIYVENGGKNTTGNLVTLCANHHTAAHAGLIKIKKPRSVRESK